MKDFLVSTQIFREMGIYTRKVANGKNPEFFNEPDILKRVSVNVLKRKKYRNNRISWAMYFFNYLNPYFSKVS